MNSACHDGNHLWNFHAHLTDSASKLRASKHYLTLQNFRLKSIRYLITQVSGRG